MAAFSSVVMGDIQGMAALLVAIHTAADLFSGEDRIGLLARKHLKQFSYADDCISFSRIMKDRDEICQRIDYILTTAGFKLHGWLHAAIPSYEGEEVKTVTDRTGYQLHYETCSFCGNHHDQDGMSGVLGYILCERCDHFLTMVKWNFAKRFRGRPQGEPLLYPATMEEVRKYLEKFVTNKFMYNSDSTLYSLVYNQMSCMYGVMVYQSV